MSCAVSKRRQASTLPASIRSDMCRLLVVRSQELFHAADRLSRFPRTSFLIAHARSAFEDRDITVENNMPFSDGERIFIFNGELRGVKLHEQGRIGAEKIFNFIRRFDRGDTLAALKKAVELIRKRTRYIRGMNIIMAKGGAI